MHATAEALLDAVDQLLASEGHAAVTSRRVTERAGTTHGSIRYHFGSLEALLVAAFRRENDAMLARQAELYSGDLTPLEKWRKATRVYFEDDLESGWARRLTEATYLAIDHPALRAELLPQFHGWRRLIADVVQQALDDAGVELDPTFVRGIAATIVSSQASMIGERLAGSSLWHDEYLQTWDHLIEHFVEPKEKP